MKDSLHWLNGESMSNVPSSWGLNRAFYFGESVFTTMRVEEGKLCFKDDHLARVTQQCSEFYQLEAVSDIQNLIEKDFEKINIRKSFGKLRLTLFFDEEPFKVNQLSRLISLTPYEYCQETIQAQSKKIHADSLRSIKMGSYARLFYLRRELPAQFNDLLLLDEKEAVLELATSNIFFMKDNKVYFPEYNHLFLAGITMNHWKKCLEQNFDITEIRIEYQDLKNFDQAYACNSLNWLRPIKQIDSHSFENSCFEQLQKLWSEYEPY